MLKDERLEKMEYYVNENKYAKIVDIMERFQLSRATVRRDLELLARAKRLELTRGGAVSCAKGTTYELPYLEKRKANNEEKQRIAKAAADYINSGETVMIDSGTTCFEMPGYLKDKKNVSVVTNDIMIALGLTNCPYIETIIVGGSLRKQFYTVSGYHAAHFVKDFHFDKAFLCVDSINLEHGCMITNMDEVEVKRGIIAAAKEVIVLCDHTKFESTAFVGICGCQAISKIITGRELNPEIGKSFLDAGKDIELV